MTKFSPLELLHPDGSASTSVVLGSDCPDSLSPAPQIETDRQIELFIVAPSIRECRSPGWLDGSAERVKNRLSNDGVCYLIVPLPWRRRMIRLLSRGNLVVDSLFWHVPNHASSQYLVPLQRGPALFAIEKIIAAPVWKRALGREILRHVNTRKLIGAFRKSTGICVRRLGSRPLFAWLFKREREAVSSGSAIIRKSWKGFHESIILYSFRDQDLQPSAITKTSPIGNSPACLAGEAEILETLSPGVQGTGVQVPQVVRKECKDQRLSLFLTHLQGRSASDLLASDPGLLTPILTKVVTWLGLWHKATVNVRPLSREQLERVFFAPIERLAPSLRNAEGYRDWMQDRIRAVVSTGSPLVAAHNDLTMANILVNEQGHLGIVDWETGMEEYLPLADFYYAVTDAVRIAERHTNWLEAFKACYQAHGPHTPDIATWEYRLRTNIDISPAFAELCFHACWLHHASNEHRVSPPDAPRQFLHIVQWLALNGSNANGSRIANDGKSTDKGEASF